MGSKHVPGCRRGRRRGLHLRARTGQTCSSQCDWQVKAIISLSKVGHQHYFVVKSGPLFDPYTLIYDFWLKTTEYNRSPDLDVDLAGGGLAEGQVRHGLPHLEHR